MSATTDDWEMEPPAPEPAVPPPKDPASKSPADDGHAIGTVTTTTLPNGTRVAVVSG